MSIPGSSNALFLATAAGGGGGGYAISRSLRFNSSDSAYLSRTPASASNRKTWTWAGWVKLSVPNTTNTFFGATSAANFYDASAQTVFSFYTDKIWLYEYTGTSTVFDKITTQVFRDFSAWYHVVVTHDSDNATAEDRIRLYVNGVRITTFSTSTNPSSGSQSYINTAIPHYISGPNNYFRGYLADIHFIDGQALDPTSFGEFDATTGVWNPKAYIGSYGTNGFHLEFADNSAATATTLGKDTSGNGNNWTPTNFSVTTTAYTTANSITSSGSLVNAQRILDGTASADATIASGTAWVEFNPPGGIAYTSSVEVMGAGSPSSPYNGRWQLNSGALINQVNAQTWVTLATGSGTITKIRNQVDTGGINWRGIRVDGVILKEESGPGIDSLVDVPTNGAQTDTGVGGEVRGNYATLNPLVTNSTTTFANGNLDATGSEQVTGFSSIVPSSGKWYLEITLGTVGTNSFIGLSGTTPIFGSYCVYGINGYGFANTGWGSPSSTVSGTGAAGDVIGLAFDVDAKTLQFYKNGSSIGTISAFTFPQNWSIGFRCNAAVSTPWVFNFGQRPFAYTAPSGFKALCTANLPAPLVTKPSTVMDVKLYTGNGSTQTISGLGFSPDLVWIKSRSGTNRAHRLIDTVRGATLSLFSNQTDAELTESTGLTAFNSDGFSIGSQAAFNTGSETYVAWTWDAGSSTVTNTQGSITSSVRANATAGFSVVSWSANNAANQSIGHGLGVTPAFIIHKNRTTAGNWNCWFTGFSNDEYINLNGTGAKASTGGGLWYQTPTSSVFYIGFTGSAINSGTDAIISYCFAPVSGYSSFGSYTGTSGQNFVHLGFRPKLLMIKNSSNGSFPAYTGWAMFDSSRSTYNVNTNALWANSSQQEGLRGNGGTVTTADFAIDLLSNGFCLRDNGASEINLSGNTYIFAAWAENPFAYARAR